MPRRAHLLTALVLVLGACDVFRGAPAVPTEEAPVVELGPDAEELRAVGGDLVTTTGLDGNRLLDGVLAAGTDATPPSLAVPAPAGATHLLAAPVVGGTLLLALGPSPAGWLVGPDATVRRLPDATLAGFGATAPRGRPSVQQRDGRWVVESGSPGGGDGTWVVDGRTIEADGSGRLVVDGVPVLDDLLHDARFAVRDGVLAVLAGPTTRVPHGALGDTVEAASVVFVDLARAAVTARVAVADDEVVEGLGVVLVEGAQGSDAVVTISDRAVGARQAVLAPDGTFVDGPAIGRGNRWRHLLGVADGRLHEIVTPHLSRTWQVLSRRDGRLVVDTSVDGALASHAVGSLDLDQALLVRADDGDVLALGPSHDDGTVLRVLDAAGAVRSEVPLDAVPTSNLAGWVTAAGDAVVAVVAGERLVLVGAG